MTHECMNTDGVMETVARDSLWAVYFDDGRSPTLQRERVVDDNEGGQYWAANLRHQGKRDVRVVQVCLGETPTFGIYKVCRGRAAIEPNRGDHFPDASKMVQFGKPPAGGES